MRGPAELFYYNTRNVLCREIYSIDGEWNLEIENNAYGVPIALIFHIYLSREKCGKINLLRWCKHEWEGEE